MKSEVCYHGIKVNTCFSCWRKQFSKAALVSVCLLGLAACGKSNSSESGLTLSHGPLVNPPPPCTVQNATNGAIITCGDTKGVVFNGTNGYNALINQTAVDSTLCPNGGYVFTMGDDKDANGILYYSEITSTAVVCNGTNAPATPFSPIGLLAPCAADPMHPTATELSNPNLEVFLALSNGTVLDSYSETVAGYNTHFGVLSSGTYESTGAGNCTFTYSNGVITN